MMMRRMIQKATFMKMRCLLTLSVTGGNPYLRLILTFLKIFAMKRMKDEKKKLRKMLKMGMTLDMIQTRKTQCLRRVKTAWKMMMMVMTAGSPHQTLRTRKNSSQEILEGSRSPRLDLFGFFLLNQLKSISSQVAVACMTTDFAMQNVLKQIGLNILGTDGMVIY